MKTILLFIKREIGRCKKFGRYNYAVRQWLDKMNALFGDLFGYVVIVTSGGCVVFAALHLALIDDLVHGRFLLAVRVVFAVWMITGIIAAGAIAIWFINTYIFPSKARGARFKERTRLEYEAWCRKVNGER